MTQPIYDAVVVGGGPSGATAANELARAGKNVVLLDRSGRIKPCGGAIPPRLIRDFEIPQSLLCAQIRSARIVSPTDRKVDMPIDGGFVGMVNREVFDEYLRTRAAESGAERRVGLYERMSREDDGTAVVHYRGAAKPGAGAKPTVGPLESIRTRLVIGADGARSLVARQEVPDGDKVHCVFAYHEVVKVPEASEVPDYDGRRCDVVYNGQVSPDFYGWVFPHGSTASVGTGSANKGFSLRGSVADLRAATGLDGVETIRREGAPIPMKPLKKWDNKRDVLLAGDAAGVVAPSSGEGIYYAMVGGQLAAEAGLEFLETGRASALAGARRRFMKAHGRVFWILGLMQRFFYCNDNRRERFVTMCQDEDVQRLTWQAYMNKELVRANPMAHVRIFFKDMAHLMGLVSP
ncbi:MAG: geranylgeranyl diphosphate reductase [Myxococcota bacterium]